MPEVLGHNLRKSVYLLCTRHCWGRNFAMAAQGGGSASCAERATTPNRFEFSPPLMSVEEAAAISLGYSTDGFEQLLTERMAEHGVVLVTGVLAEAEVKAAEEAMGRDLAATLDPVALLNAPGPMKKHCKKLCTPGTLPAAWPADASVGTRGMACGLSLPSGSFAWSLRLHPTVRGLFSTLYAVSPEDMVVSIDNPFFAARGETAPPKQECWLHADVNSSVHPQGSLPCYQGVAYVWDAQSDKCSTTVVVPGSHADGSFQTLMDDPAHAGSRSHFCKVFAMGEGEDRDTLLRGIYARARRVPVPPGAVLLWSSRTLHQGWREGSRLAQAVAWEPSDRRSAQARCRKVGAVLAGASTTHWASLGVWHSLGSWFEPTPAGKVGRTLIPPTHHPKPWAVLPSATGTPQQMEEVGRFLKGLSQAKKGPPTVKAGARAVGALAALGVECSGTDLASVVEAAVGLLRPEVTEAL